MTQQDTVTARGQLVTDYIESKERIALVGNKIDSALKAFTEVVESIMSHGLPGASGERLRAALGALPDNDDLLSDCADLRAEDSHYKFLAQAIKSLNL